MYFILADFYVGKAEQNRNLTNWGIFWLEKAQGARSPKGPKPKGPEAQNAIFHTNWEYARVLGDWRSKVGIGNGRIGFRPFNNVQ